MIFPAYFYQPTLTTMKIKIKLLLVPFVMAMLVYTALYGTLYYILFAQIGNVNIPDVWPEFAFPIIGGVAISYFVLLKKAQETLILTSTRKDHASTFLIVGAIGLAAPSIFLASFLKKESGKLTSLEHISELSQADYTMYYSVNDYFIDTKRMSVYSRAKSTRKRNTYHTYIVVPVLADASDTLHGEALAWIGFQFDETSRYRAHGNSRDSILEEFEISSLASFHSKNLSNFTYLQRVGNNEARGGFENAILRNETYAKNPQIFLAHFGDFEKRIGNRPVWIFLSIIGGTTLWMITFSFYKLRSDVSTEHERKNDGPIEIRH